MATDVSNTFHVYAMEWTTDEITFSLDGVPYYTYSPSPQNMSTWPYIADQYILLNIAIQNSIDPAFTDSEMVLDYIRVYQQGTSSTVDEQNVCDSYTWIDGNTYTSSNTSATYNLPNVDGCDSTIQLDLTINNSFSGIDTYTSCDSYTWIDGNTYTSNNNSATAQYTSVYGCDSTITLDLVINQSTSSSITETAIDSYTLNGVTYDTTGVYSQTINNSAGCDSTITINLTIESSVGIIENIEEVLVYPNPTNEKIRVSVPSQLIGAKATIIDASGKEIFSYIQSKKRMIIECADYPKGSYIVSFQNGELTSKVNFVRI